VDWFWLLVAAGVLLAAFSLRGERAHAEFVTSLLAPDPPGAWRPAASILVPVDGTEDRLKERLESFAAQNYPEYELILIVRSPRDLPAGMLPRRARVTFCGAGEPLYSGLKAARRMSQAVAVAAAGGIVSPDWLRCLVAPLGDENTAMSTGSVWYTPEPPGFWPFLRSIWNAQMTEAIAAAPAPIWRGSMAMRKQSMEEVLRQLRDGPEPTGVFAPGAMISVTRATPMTGVLREAASRLSGYRDLRLGWWRAQLWSHLIQCAAMAAILGAVAAGSRLAEWALVAQFGLIMLKGANRATLAKAALPQSEAWFKRHSWVLILWAPLGMWIWLLTLLLSAMVSPGPCAADAILGETNVGG
jgi:hypothetical protein